MKLFFSYTIPVSEEDAVETTQPAGVRQSARISFNEGSFKRPRAKRGSLSAQVLEKNTAAAAEEERIVEGQVGPGDTIKLEGNGNPTVVICSSMEKARVACLNWYRHLTRMEEDDPVKVEKE